MEPNYSIVLGEEQKIPSRVDLSGIFFDPASQHFVLHSEGQFFTWSFSNQEVELLFDLGNDYKRNSSGAENVLFAKLSLDRELLAIQFTETQLSVIELKTNMRWAIEIKSSYDNRILDGGLVWSQHGGGSEDLIIVAVRGAEMYKISSKRNQCKLSRVLNQGHQYHAHFWYEPNHRVLLMASPIKGLDVVNSSVGGFLGFFSNHSKAAEQRKMLLQDLGQIALGGYFLRTDKDNTLPKLELPPPDKTPAFEVGPRVRRADVELAAIYDEVYCVVHSRRGPDYYLEGNVKLFRLAKDSVTHTHTLMLQHSSPRTSYQPHCTVFSFSVTDNLLLVHCKRDMCTAVFDIAGTGQDGANPGPSVDGGLKRKGADKVTRTESNVPAGFATDNSNTDASVDARQKKGAHARVAELFPLAPALPVAKASEGEQPPTGATEGQYFSNAPESVLVSHEQHLDQALRPVRALTAEDVYLYKDGSEAVRYHFYPPYWVFDSVARTVRRLRLRISPLLGAIRHRPPSFYASFLMRRGGALRAPRVCYDHNCGDLKWRERCSVHSKLLLLHKVGECLEIGASLSYLEKLFEALCGPYSREQYRAAVSQQKSFEAAPMAHISGRGLLSEASTPQRSPQPSPATHTAEQTPPATTKGVESSPGLGLDAPVPDVGDPHADPRISTGERLLDLVSTATDSVLGSPAMDTITDLMSDVQELYYSSIQSYSESIGRWVGVDSVEVGCDEENLEPPQSWPLLLPDLSRVTAATLKKGLQSSGVVPDKGGQVPGPEPPVAPLQSAEGGKFNPAILTNSAGFPLSTRRNEAGLLIVTQSELLSVVWMPLALINTKLVPAEQTVYALTLYLGVLRGAGAVALPAASALLVRLLSAQRRYSEISRLLQLQFFSDSSEVALATLELCDVLQQADPQLFLLEKVTVRALHQVGLDMLWRMHEKTLVIRWLCGHGRVGEAMALCVRKKGRWRRGLSPRDINGCHFYQGALLAVEQRCQVSRKGKSKSKSKGKGKGKGKGASLEEEQAFSLPYARRVALLYAVYRFLVSWDPDLMKSTNQDRSQLASQARFPAGLKDRDELHLRGLFGFGVTDALISTMRENASIT